MPFEIDVVALCAQHKYVMAFNELGFLPFLFVVDLCQHTVDVGVWVISFSF